VSLVAEDSAGRRVLATAPIPVGRVLDRDVTMDDMEAELSGRWAPYVPDVYTGPFAYRDVVLRGKTMPARARFHPDVPRTGRYEVCLGFRTAAGQSRAVAVRIRHASGLARLKVDQRTGESPFPFVALGAYRFSSAQESWVELDNGDAGGRVVIDGLRLVWLGE
jgi:hypothetical protein